MTAWGRLRSVNNPLRQSASSLKPPLPRQSQTTTRLQTPPRIPIPQLTSLRHLRPPRLGHTRFTFGFFHTAVNGLGDALQGASELADAILPQTLSTSPQCRDNGIATLFRYKCRNLNIATGAQMANAPLMHEYQAVEDVITQYPEGVAIDQCVWRD